MIARLALVAALFALPAAAEGLQERTTVTGTVRDGSTGQPLEGVAVQLVGLPGGTFTNAEGRYVIQAPANGRLQFSRIGYAPMELEINGRSTVDATLGISATELDALVVTGYQTQRRGDITSAVSTVNADALELETSASVLQRLDGAVPGVVVENSGSPGSRSTVRVRGVSSFQNNDPLYIIDGQPVEETFANFLNPHDIESIQVLKDASAASIYGSRASNGVIIITTKKGLQSGAPQFSVDARFGLSQPVRGYDDFLMTDPLDYFEFERRRYVNSGQVIPDWLTAIYGDPDNPSIPQYIYAPSGVGTRDEWGRITGIDESVYSFPNLLIMPGSQGTNWWDAVFGTGDVKDVNIAVRGGSANARYAVGVNYFDQVGTAIFNEFERGTVRVNSDFTSGRLTIGENLTVSVEEAYGGIAGDNFGEGNILGKNILSQPVIPIYDVGGNFASGKATGLGNNTNPVKIAENGQDNRSTNTRIFGNVFVRLGLTDWLDANSSLGINRGDGLFWGYNPITPENSEPNFIDGIFEGQFRFTTFTWNNTLNLNRTFQDRHNLNALVGQEAVWGSSRNLNGSMSDLVSTNIDSRFIQPALGNPATRNVTSSGGESSLLSFFGKVDYNFDSRYYLSGTLRRDGSSRLSENNRWGTFPALSAGWRASEEAFMQENDLISNLMLRFGWGVTGNQNIAAGRTVDWFGGSVGTSFYDIGGTNTSVVPGYRQVAIGNPNLKWEENESMNLGVDVEFLGGATTFVLDVYQRDSDNLLFNPPLPAAAGLASAPIVNVGEVRNTGFDAQLGFRGTFANGIGWGVDLNGATYSNEIVRIDGERTFFFGPVGTRTATAAGGGVTRNQIGHPIGSFYGLEHVGFFQTQEEIDALNAQARAATGDPDAVYQDGAAPGRFRFADVNGDGVVNAADRTIIGDPHPDFTTGLNLTLDWGRWDLGANVFGSFGNDIFDVQKEFYVFAVFPTNVRRDLLTDSWTPENTNAKYPRLDATDVFSLEPSSFYVEDGSYVRMRSLQVGYQIPPSLVRGLDNARVYIRGENLFTITGYDGLDPSLPALQANAAGMDVRDQARGIDRGVYPTSRTISIGFGLGF
ncbi:MAG TPA: TonB-dependent receptor [Gemmatimonadota bacterium]|nr:TonB-dependent receptor [Gemmatimonadota bacterium]